MKMHGIGVVSVLLLSGCAGEPTPYQPAATRWADGYSERRIAEDTFYVTYRASSRTPGRVVCAYLYHRAAEVTLQYGFDYFAVIRGPRMPTGLDVSYVHREDAGDDWEPVVVETSVSGTLFITIQCLKEAQEMPGARLIDARGYLERNPHPWP